MDGESPWGSQREIQSGEHPFDRRIENERELPEREQTYNFVRRFFRRQHPPQTHQGNSDQHFQCSIIPSEKLAIH